MNQQIITEHNKSLLINLASTTSPFGAQKTMRSRIFGSGFNYSMGLGESFESHPKIWNGLLSCALKISWNDSNFKLFESQ